MAQSCRVDDGWCGGGFAGGDDGGQCLGGAGCDGGVDGDLVVLLVVDQFQAEGGEQPGLDAGGQARQGVRERRQQVQEGGVVVLAGGPVHGREALVDLGPLGL